MPTDCRFTGQREESGLGSLYDYNARFYSSVLGRFISADTIVPDGKNPQAWNRYAYTLNSPLRCTDPTGHWTEEELIAILGKDWYEVYFGDKMGIKGIFAGRKALASFLQSPDTTDPVVLGMVAAMMSGARIAHDLGYTFENIDALGMRISSTAGAGVPGLFAGASADAVQNLNSGEYSLFVSPEIGIGFGASAGVVGGILALKQLPSNDSYRGNFMAVGLIGGDGPGANVEDSGHRLCQTVIILGRSRTVHSVVVAQLWESGRMVPYRILKRFIG